MIEVEGFLGGTLDEVVPTLPGSVVQLVVGGTIRPEGTPWGEFFRFARVVSVTRLERDPARSCPRCETESPCFSLRLTWESGFQSDDGEVACENCVDGIVTKGSELIAFGSDSWGDDEVKLSTSYEL